MIVGKKLTRNQAKGCRAGGRHLRARLASRIYQAGERALVRGASFPRPRDDLITATCVQIMPVVVGIRDLASAEEEAPKS
jgi:hypothetical protein